MLCVWVPATPSERGARGLTRVLYALCSSAGEGGGGTWVALRYTSAPISAARRAEAVSVVKKGLPVPPPKMTTRPRSRCRTARRRMYGSAISRISIAVCTLTCSARSARVMSLWEPGHAWGLTALGRYVEMCKHDHRSWLWSTCMKGSSRPRQGSVAGMGRKVCLR